MPEHPSRCIALIPARQGSKGIPDKNIRLIQGVPMLIYAIAAARLSAEIDEVWVSTDSPRYAEIARAAGADVIMRPEELAQDSTPDRPVADHVLSILNERGLGDIAMVAWIRPTSPLRATEDIDAALSLLGQRPDAQSLRSVAPVKEHPYWMKTIGDSGLVEPFVEGCHELSHPRRQLLPPAYYPDCLIDAFRPASLDPSGGIFPGPTLAFTCQQSASIDIDVPRDLEFAEETLAEKPEAFKELVEFAGSIYQG